MIGGRMLKNSWFIWVISIFVIALLFLLSSTDLIIKEDQVTIYQIATILDETSDANIPNFRKGMERAATELKVDMRVIPLFEYGNMEDQKKKMHEEVANGVAAMILNPVDAPNNLDYLLEGLESPRASMPIAVYDNMAPHYSYVDIGIDYSRAGERLGAAIGIEKPQSKTILFFYSGSKEGEYNEVLYDSVKSKLESLNHDTDLFYGKPENNYDFRVKISKLAEEYETKPVIVCLDRLSLDMTAKMLDSLPSYKELIGGLYGTGNSLYLLNKLADGTIDGLIVWNEYAAGYLAVESVVEQLKFPGLKRDEILDSYYIRSNDLDNRNFMRILFPLN